MTKIRVVKGTATPLALAVVLILASQARAAWTNTDPLITVDEFGVGTLDFSAEGGGVFPLTGVLAPDPGPGGLPSVLTYDLLGPPGLVAGDVLLFDPDVGAVLDVIRFNPAGTGGPGYPASLLFYSDNIGGADAPGDTPSPPTAFYPNQRTLTELGPEGGIQYADYTPGPNDPGFVPGFAVSYHLISDVPEPATVGLLAAGAMLLRLRRRA